MLYLLFMRQFYITFQKKVRMVFVLICFSLKRNLSSCLHLLLTGQSNKFCRFWIVLYLFISYCAWSKIHYFLSVHYVCNKHHLIPFFIALFKIRHIRFREIKYYVAKCRRTRCEIYIPRIRNSFQEFCI